MAHTPDPDTVFTKPEAPRSDWELFKWMFFEPTLLKQYGRMLGRRESVLPVIRVYCKFIVPLVLLAYLLLVTFLVAIDLPGWLPDLFRFHNDAWQSLQGFVERWLFLVRELTLDLAFVLASILAIGLVSRQVGWLAFILHFGLTLLIGSLASGLMIYWAVGLREGMVTLLVSILAGGGLLLGLFTGRVGDGTVKVSLRVRLGAGLVLGFGMGLAAGVGIGVNMGLAVGVSTGVAFGVGLCFGFYISQFRIFFYPFHCRTLFQKNTLTQNPYLHDEGIWLPLPWVKNALRREATSNPELAFRFIDFLLRYRPLQLDLAAELEYVATAGRWQVALRLRSSLFDNLRFFKDEELPERWAKHTPSLAWRNKLAELRDSLLNAEIQTAVVLKKDYYEQCPALLREIERLLLYETFQGRDAYFPVLAHWKKALENQMQEVNQDVARVQVVSVNPYVKGNALSPGGVPELLDRQDAKDELTLKIQTSVTMPTFLILGQRRVGKTSLLNFLPVLLDQGSFAVATIDAQSMSGELSVPRWLRAWRARAAAALGIEGDAWATPDDWLEAWDAFAEFLRQATQGNKRRLILAMDEYDEEFGFHHALRQDPARAAAFLSRMRAFSQSEKRIVFLFVGAAQFSDLPEPKWSKYFVHIHIVRVDYLTETSSLQLIERPSVNFKMKYKEGVSQHIYKLTQGHPHLLHSICSDLVDYANIHNKNPISHGDLRKILNNKTLQKGEQPFTVFWEEFCEKPDMRKTVLTIAKHLPVNSEQPEVRHLLEYGYIVPDSDTGFRMRVPLFEEWVLRFGY